MSSDLSTFEDIPVQIDTKAVNGKSGPLTIYEITTYKGVTVSTSIRQIAEEAHALLNKPAILTIKTQVKPSTDGTRTFTNRYLQSIAPHGASDVGAAMAQAQAAHAQALPQGAATFTTYAPTAVTTTSSGFGPATVGVTPSLPVGKTSEQIADEVEQRMLAAEKRRNDSIHRQTATKVAALKSETMDEFWANVESLVRFYATGDMPVTTQVFAPLPQSGAPEPFIPSGALASPLDDAPFPADDDIPF